MSARLGHSDLYEVSSITVALAEVAVLRGIQSHQALAGRIESGDAGLVLPATLVATISNRDTSSTRSIYVREIVLHIIDYMPQRYALTGLGGLVLRAVQAGGRGPDASFTVRFRATRRAKYRLLMSAVSDGYDGPMRMRIDPGRFAEFAFKLWPEVPGRYRASVEFEFTDGHRAWSVRVKQTLAIYHLGADAHLDLPVIIETHEFTDVMPATVESFMDVLAGKRALLPEMAALPADRTVTVTAAMVAEAG